MIATTLQVRRQARQAKPGLRLGRAAVAALVLAAATAGNTAWATDAAPAAACWGRTWRVSGTVEADGGGKIRRLREGDLVYVGEHIRARAESEAVLRTADAGLVALRPGAELVVEDFQARGQDSDRMSLRLVLGWLRLVSGWVDQVNHDGMQVLTPTASIMVHGTDYEPYVLPEDQADPTPYDAGTYDKVNHGETVLKSASGQVQVKSTQVAVAPLPQPPAPGDSPKRGTSERPRPVLLEQTPEIYTPGRFEHDIDAYSRDSATRIHSSLAQVQAGGAVPECGGS